MLLRRFLHIYKENERERMCFVDMSGGEEEPQTRGVCREYCGDKVDQKAPANPKRRRQEREWDGGS